MKYPVSPPESAKVMPPSLVAASNPRWDPLEDDGRCDATTWHYGKPESRQKPKYEQRYGPGGYNRCIYTTEEHVVHRDEWGHLFVIEPEFKLVGRADPDA